MEMLGVERNTYAWHAVLCAPVHVRLAVLAVRSDSLAERTVSEADRTFSIVSLAICFFYELKSRVTQCVARKIPDLVLPTMRKALCPPWHY